MSDIIGRLLDEAQKAQRKGHLVLAKVCRDASDQLGLITNERDEAIQRGNDWCDQARKLRDERDRLGAALREIVQQCFEHEGRANIAATARAALKETGHE